MYSLSPSSQEFVRQAVDMSRMDKMALWKEQDPGRIGDVLVAVSLGPYLRGQNLMGTQYTITSCRPEKAIRSSSIMSTRGRSSTSSTATYPIPASMRKRSESRPSRVQEVLTQIMMAAQWVLFPPIQWEGLTTTTTLSSRISTTV